MMKAIVFEGKPKYVEDYPMPTPKTGEALIRVAMAGICNTDLEIMKGYMGFTGVMGHEFAGIMEEVNGEAPYPTGTRVVGEINCACHLCDYCVKDLKSHCVNRTPLGISGRDGAFAEYVALPVTNLHEVPEHITDEEATFAEPLAAAFEILEQVHIQPGRKKLVMGDGKLGILCALALNLTPARVTLAGKHAGKLRLAEDQGVETVLLEGLTPQKQFDLVVEATGSPDGFVQALPFVKPRGTIILKSTLAEGTMMNLAPVVIDEIHVIGSRCGPFEPALQALSRGLINVKPLVSSVFTPHRFAEAFSAARERNSLKVLIDFRQP
jgi:alcohol dehydrogenase